MNGKATLGRAAALAAMAAAAAALLFSQRMPAAAQVVTDSVVPPTVVASNLSSPIGIACTRDGRLIVSVNWPNWPASPATSGPGPLPNFVQIRPGGPLPNNGVQFSSVAGVFDEAKLAASAIGAYGRDAIYFGSDAGYSGVTDPVTGSAIPVAPAVGRMSEDGTVLNKFWAPLPGATRIVTGLAFDKTGVFLRYMYALTEDGKVWRIGQGGAATLFCDIRAQIPSLKETEGMAIIPDLPARYGPLAGKIVVGGENLGRVYLVDADRRATFVNLPGVVHPEDLIVTPAAADLYAVDHAAGTVLGLTAAQLASAGVTAGDLLIADEFASSAEVPGSAPLWRITWTGSAFQASEVATATQWEQLAFFVHG